ncbi:MAG: laccase domain-containing protein [Ruminococcaceae bacterium]|nr:laccase domain-containing protein [Oscillospiraceae bacterium]
MAFTRHEKDGILYYTSPLFDEYKIPHFFCAKLGGVSDGVFSSLNFSSVRKDKCGNTDKEENIRENLKRALDIIGSDETKCALMKQTHSAEVVKAERSCFDIFGTRSDFPPCDGIFAPYGGNIDTVGVKTADCVPILLYDLKNDIPCAIHAGWRGSVGNIVGNAVRLIKKEYPDADIIAAIGPCILDCCYEVNDVVKDALFSHCDSLGIKRSAPEACFTESYIKDGENKYKINLPRINAIYLENESVTADKISFSGICTCCNSDIFFSHRASGGYSGTQLSAVGMRSF